MNERLVNNEYYYCNSKKANVESVSWFGHVTRDDTHSKAILQGAVEEQVHTFKYLSTWVTSDARCNTGINNRLGQVTTASYAINSSPLWLQKNPYMLPKTSFKTWLLIVYNW